ncbi:MAG: SMI1/KNR4 family protein [Azoarcus sp.]|jgi:hypothetical protein|nr:SMI1/KNR4 family protein [Azoarcus sp.]
MNTSIDELAKAVLSARRKGLFKSKPIFEVYAQTSPDELRHLEGRIGTSLPLSLRNWLLKVGYGDINEELSFREEWFSPIEVEEGWFSPVEEGQLKGGAIFAQDDLGNFYAFNSSGQIYFLSRSEPFCAVMSNDFLGFVQELVCRDYKLGTWIESLDTQKNK